ncbi:MAG: L-carnitine dehydratase/bile acid-inducible protein [Betaproteobacteria bacterium]|nr:L-carnitine dehydratase/bile acid-inducible protein [Betaproteobacteria bacterium]
MAGGPLKDVRVVDLTSVVVGPMVTLMLADYGADIIKVEPPTGDIVRNLAGRAISPNMSPKFLHLNRNKRSLAIDLKKPEAYAALKKLLAKADVLLWNVRPSAMARLKLSYEDVKAINPKIIYCGIVGFGQTGRYKSKPAYDSIIQGSAGIAALHHRATGEPRYVPIVMADKTTGLIATQMVLMALYHRERTGEGQSIEVPMFENIARYVLEEHMYHQTFDPPIGTTGDPRIFDPWARPVPTKDGYICISANTNAQAFAVFDAIGKPEFKTDARFSTVAARFKHVPEYFAARAEGLKQKTTAEWIEIFDKSDVPAMQYHTLETLMQDPHLNDVGFFRKFDHPTEGRMIDMALTNKSTAGARTDFIPAPTIGQHTVEILREAGYDETAITAMVTAGIAVDGRLAAKPKA